MLSLETVYKEEIRMPTRKEVYDAIDSERDYQDKTWPRSTDLSVLGEVTLVRQYIRKFEDEYQADNDEPGREVPAECMNVLRKMATLLVRAMENHGAPLR